MSSDRIENKKLIKKNLKNNSGQLGLTRQTCNLSHKMGITSYKAIEINHET
jgi:hypothetical protein